MTACVQKMSDTSTKHDKLYFTLNIFRACRLLDYKFIAKTPLPSLLQLPTLPGEFIRGEIVQLYTLPFIVKDRNDQFLQPFVDELPKYRSLCLAYLNQNSRCQACCSWWRPWIGWRNKSDRAYCGEYCWAAY
jgi:hypothetical protein